MDEARLQAVVVSFGEAEAAKHWQEESKNIFPHYRDYERNLYSALGLQRSVKVVWGVSTISYYGAQVAKGVKLPTTIPQTNLKDDPHQMGGDFTVDSSGRIVFIHRSANPVDRPAVDAILSAVRMSS